MKRFILYMFIILLVISIYKDMTTGILPDTSSKLTTDNTHETEKLTVVRVKAGKGDTVLSIVESINELNNQVAVSKILDDFRSINPDTDPFHVKSGEYYFFPLYKKGAD
ncbi:hypothetical protein GCM10008983_20520 [Lentibacillus halophilus]|uniref:LysM domain-containing protein n=1 Tax=Lentibacillus halophilus TaxID=295065 RepID=A0ABN0ZD40_9BACI